ncbi:MAG: hypothetical protein PHC51_14315 [bacterium]|nr:hypothetical protein [bacterium]
MTIFSTPHIKSTIATEAFQLMNSHAQKLAKFGASLRLLSGLLRMPDYGSVYKRLIDKNEDFSTEIRRRVPDYEKKLLAQWELSNPVLNNAMSTRGITPRRWCNIYRLMNDDNYPDLSALTNPEIFEGNHDMLYGTIMALLREDFPEAFSGKSMSYWAAEVDPDLYFYYERTYSHGDIRHIFWSEALEIKVINKSDFLAYSIFTKRLLQEVRIQRMIRLINLGLSAENIRLALAWLPEDVSESRPKYGGENQGIGHKLMRAAEIARQKEVEEKSRKSLAKQ